MAPLLFPLPFSSPFISPSSSSLLLTPSPSHPLPLSPSPPLTPFSFHLPLSLLSPSHPLPLSPPPPLTLSPSHPLPLSPPPPLPSAPSVAPVDQGLPRPRSPCGGTSEQPPEERDAPPQTFQTLQQKEPGETAQSRHHMLS